MSPRPEPLCCPVCTQTFDHWIPEDDGTWSFDGEWWSDPCLPILDGLLGFTCSFPCYRARLEEAECSPLPNKGCSCVMHSTGCQTPPT